MTLDPFAKKMPGGEYLVRSVYYDNDRHSTYKEKIDGVKLRNKFRIRGYNSRTEDSIVFLEIKRKESDFISKDRARLRLKDAAALFSSKDYNKYIIESPSREKELAQARNFLYYYYSLPLKPVYQVVYNREAMQCRFGSGLRITFDKFVRSTPVSSLESLFSDDHLKHMWPGFFTLEIKFHQVLPTWLPRILNRFDLTRTSASKYATCFEAHNTIHDFKVRQRAAFAHLFRDGRPNRI